MGMSACVRDLKCVARAEIGNQMKLSKSVLYVSWTVSHETKAIHSAVEQHYTMRWLQFVVRKASIFQPPVDL